MLPFLSLFLLSSFSSLLPSSVPVVFVLLPSLARSSPSTLHSALATSFVLSHRIVIQRHSEAKKGLVLLLSLPL